jgi:hypothetical protein
MQAFLHELNVQSHSPSTRGGPKEGHCTLTAVTVPVVGAEKVLRVFDLHRPESTPQEMAATPDNIRCATWVKGNALLLVSYLDKAQLECVCALHFGLRERCRSPLSSIPPSCFKGFHTCTSAQSSSTCLIIDSSLSCSIWDVRTQQVARSIPTSSAVSSIEVTRGEEHIVLAQDDKVHDLLLLCSSTHYNMWYLLPAHSCAPAMKGAARGAVFNPI